MDKMFKVFNTEIRGIDEKERTLTALVSTDAIDRMGEVLSPDGADLKQFKKNPVVLWAHNYSHPPIGKALWIKKTAEGILSKVQFAATEFAQEVFQLYKDGFMKAFSVGFIPKKWDDGDEKKEISRTYNEWEMIEYSAVPVPANPEALALAFQKGVLKNNEIINEFKKAVDEQDSEEENENQKPENKNMLDELKTLHEDINTKNTEIDNYKQAIKDLGESIADLKFRLYQAVQPKETKKEKDLSEMTGGEITKIAKDEIARVIRQITGKVS